MRSTRETLIDTALFFLVGVPLILAIGGKLLCFGWKESTMSGCLLPALDGAYTLLLGAFTIAGFLGIFWLPPVVLLAALSFRMKRERRLEQNPASQTVADKATTVIALLPIAALIAIIGFPILVIITILLQSVI